MDAKVFIFTPEVIQNQPEITIIQDIENFRVLSIASDLGAQKPS